MTREEAYSIIREKLSIADAITFDYYSWALREKDKEALRIALESIKGIIGKESEIPSKLTWEDVRKIVEIFEDLDTLSWLDDEPMFGSNQEFFEEVLQRFKEERQ